MFLPTIAGDSAAYCSGLGRKMIFTDLIPDETNIQTIISSAMLIHDQNAAREQWLYDYKRGIQPILGREKQVRPEINNRVVENNASKIVDCHLAYDFANPLTFVRVRKEDAEGQVEDEAFSTLNAMMQAQSKAKKDVEMGDWLLTGGVAYMAALKNPDKESSVPFVLAVPNPLTTFVVYSNDIYREPVLAVTYSVRSDGTLDITAYSKELFYRYSGVLKTDLENPVIEPNIYGAIPIVEFTMTDRMGVFEKVIPLMDAVSQINSDRVNDIAQHVQSLLWINNAEIDETLYRKMREEGLVMTQSQDGVQASIEYLSQTLDQSQVQSFVDYLNDQILQITSTPSWAGSSGGSTTGAMQLSNGWQMLELSAKTVEMLFYEPEMRLLKVVKKILTMTGGDYNGAELIDIADVDIKFNRNKTFDLVSKTNSLVSQLNAGIYGLDAISTIGLYTDPQKTWENSKETITRMQGALGNGENIIPNANASVDADGNGGVYNKAKDKTEESLDPSRVAGVKE